MPTDFPSSTLGIDLPSPPKGEEFMKSLLPSLTRVTSDAAVNLISCQTRVKSEEHLASLSSQARVMSDDSVISSSSQTRVTQEVSVSSLLDDEATMEDLEAADIDEEVVKSLVKGNDFSELFEPTEVVSLSPPTKKLKNGGDENIKEGATTEDSKVSLIVKENVSDVSEHSNASNEETVSSERAEGAGAISLVPLSEESRVLDRFQRRGQGGVGAGHGGDGDCGGGGGQGGGSRVVQGRLTDWLVSPYSGNRLKPYIRCCQESSNPLGSS